MFGLQFRFKSIICSAHSEHLKTFAAYLKGNNYRAGQQLWRIRQIDQVHIPKSFSKPRKTLSKTRSRACLYLEIASKKCITLNEVTLGAEAIFSSWNELFFSINWAQRPESERKLRSFEAIFRSNSKSIENCFSETWNASWNIISASSSRYEFWAVGGEN